ncbi:MAG: caspase family protein [Pseudomonadota bacterium]
MAPAFLAAGVALAVLLAAGSAAAGGRVALLIGNAEYQRPDLWLANPANDARAVAGALQDLGFETITAVDRDLDGMLAALDRFETAMAGAEIAVFFYAGHGVQIDGENHLLPADFPVDSIAGIERATLTLGRVRAAFAEAEPAVGVLVLDACRDNPFEALDVDPGLARVPGRPGLMIAYSTDPGNVAYDGAGENSAFTEALVRHVATPGVEARLMFGRVRQDVIRATEGAQIPWVEEAVIGEHFFNPAPAAEGGALAADLAAWRAAGEAADRAGYAGYLDAWPGGAFADAARARLAAFDAAPVTLAAIDPAAAAAPLAALGYLSRSAVPDRAAVERAMAAWAARAPVGADLALLRREAARALVAFGAGAGRQIRIDLVALESIDRADTVAREALAELVTLGAHLAEARPLIAAAEQDVARIAAARARVMAQLDQARAYYDEVLSLARRGLRDEIAALDPGAAAGATGARGLAEAGLEGRLRAAEALFMSHARADAARTPEGSYAWLVDFLPRP